MTDMPPPPPEQPDVPEPGYVPGDPAPAYGPGDPALAYGPADTLDSAPRRSGRRGLVIGAMAAVLAVVAGAAVYAASVLSGGGRQPDELVPKATFAYAKIDLDPAAGQKLAARSFFGKFPNLKDKANASQDDVFGNVIGTLVSDKDVSYDRDVKPWFDRRAAVAAFPGSGRKPTVVSVLRSKDDAKARASLTRLSASAQAQGTTFAFDIAKGYVVISDTLAHVEESIQQSDKESLRDNETYRKDVDTLTGDQVAVGWVDVPPAFRAAMSNVPRAGLLPTAVTDRVKGRAVIGVHFAGDYVEMEGRVLDADKSLFSTPGSKPELLDKLPGSTVAALSVNGLQQSFQDAIDLTGTDPDELAGGLVAITGLSLDKDVLPLLGSQTALAVENFDLFGPDSRMAFLSKVTDAVQARVSGAKIVKAAEQVGAPVKATVKGDTFYLATPGDYADELAASSGGLTASKKFQKATGDLGSPNEVLYVDLQAIVNADAGSPESALRSLGAVAGVDNDTPYFRMRLVVG
jgi:hypothetical protein